MPRIEKTDQVAPDIEGLVAYYVAEAGISVARRFIDHAQSAFEHLSQTPKMGALLGLQHPHADVRRWLIQSFPRLLILYRVIPDGIEVIRVLDAGRDLRDLIDDTGLFSN